MPDAPRHTAGRGVRQQARAGGERGGRRPRALRRWRRAGGGDVRGLHAVGHRSVGDQQPPCDAAVVGRWLAADAVRRQRRRQRAAERATRAAVPVRRQRRGGGGRVQRPRVRVLGHRRLCAVGRRSGSRPGGRGAVSESWRRPRRRGVCRLRPGVVCADLGVCRHRCHGGV